LPVVFNLHSEYAMKDALEERRELVINGENINNLHYVDDAVFWLVVIKICRNTDCLVQVCKEYGMEINVKKTNVMVFSPLDGFFS